MSVKLDNTFGILMTLLTAKKPVTTKQLARKHGVSDRTIVRYMDTLSRSCIPVYAIRGVKGGFVIDDEFKNTFGRRIMGACRE